MILNKDTLQSMLTCLQVMQAKVRLLQDQSQLLNDELIDLKNQQPVKCSELVFVQNNPLYDDDDDDDGTKQQCTPEKLCKTTPDEMKMKLFKFNMIKFKILFPSPSSDLGKKSTTTSTEQDLDMTRKLPFIFPIIPNQSSSKVLDSFKKFQLHLFQFNIKMLNANIAIELVTWRINVLISILANIVASITILQTMFNTEETCKIEDSL
jgi:hypothetical protein